MIPANQEFCPGGHRVRWNREFPSTTFFDVDTLWVLRRGSADRALAESSTDLFAHSQRFSTRTLTTNGKTGHALENEIAAQRFAS